MTDIPSVKDIMTSSVFTLKSDMNMSTAIDLLLKHRISGAPVVDGEGNLVGILSEKDCLRLVTGGAIHQVPEGTVEMYMSKDVNTIAPDLGLYVAAEVFLKHSYRRLPVVEDGKMVGLISRRDVLEGSRKIWQSSPVERPWSDSTYLTDEIKAALDD